MAQLTTCCGWLRTRAYHVHRGRNQVPLWLGCPLDHCNVFGGRKLFTARKLRFISGQAMAKHCLQHSNSLSLRLALATARADYGRVGVCPKVLTPPTSAPPVWMRIPWAIGGCVSAPSGPTREYSNLWAPKAPKEHKSNLCTQTQAHTTETQDKQTHNAISAPFSTKSLENCQTTSVSTEFAKKLACNRIIRQF